MKGFVYLIMSRPIRASASGKAQSIIVDQSIRCSAPFKVQEFTVMFSPVRSSGIRGGGGG